MIWRRNDHTSKYMKREGEKRRRKCILIAAEKADGGCRVVAKIGKRKKERERAGGGGKGTGGALEATLRFDKRVEARCVRDGGEYPFID